MASRKKTGELFTYHWNHLKDNFVRPGIRFVDPKIPGHIVPKQGYSITKLYKEDVPGIGLILIRSHKPILESENVNVNEDLRTNPRTYHYLIGVHQETLQANSKEETFLLRLLHENEIKQVKNFLQFKGYGKNIKTEKSG